jgi:hypothetical protein
MNYINYLTNRDKEKIDILRAKVKHKLLIWCREDYASLWSLFNFVKEFYKYKDLDLLKKTTLDIVKEVLEQELVTAGILNDENKFVPWEKEVGKIIQKIKNEWDKLGRDLQPHEIVWFNEAPWGMVEFEYLNALPELRETDPFYSDRE